jgi:hypothetical protein
MKEKLFSCLPTIVLNTNAVVVSFMQVEAIFRIASYLVAIIWTTLKIYELLKDLKSGKSKK